MPLPETTKRVTLEEVGAPEFYIEFKRIPALLHDEMKAVFPANRKALQDIETDEQATEFVDELTNRQFSALIVAWNIPDRETEKVLPIPSKDETSIGRLPSLYMEFISGQILIDQNQGGWTLDENLLKKNNSKLTPSTSTEEAESSLKV